MYLQCDPQTKWLTAWTGVYGMPPGMEAGVSGYLSRRQIQGIGEAGHLALTGLVPQCWIHWRIGAVRVDPL